MYSNVMTYYELGRYPMFVTRKIRIFKYWLILIIQIIVYLMVAILIYMICV